MRSKALTCLLVLAAQACSYELQDSETASSERALTRGADRDKSDGEPKQDEQDDDGNTLYVGDDSLDGLGSVKAFDATTGAFKKIAASDVHGPRGVLAFEDGLLVAVQNTDEDFAGELFTYKKGTATALVPHTDPAAPFAPRGVVKKGNQIYVADMGDAGGPIPSALPARVAVYDNKGKLQRSITSGLVETDNAGNYTQWSPRGLVFGPDGALYASLMKFTTTDPNPNLLPGRVLRIDKQGQTRVFVDGATCNCGLARPEGLVFGPDKRLYVTSFRLGAADTDKILIFDGKTGAYLDKIELATAAGDAARSFAQALLFGPKGKLFVPISGGVGGGTVRAYDVTTKQFSVIVPAGNLDTPFYLAFKSTDPATLAFGK